jgi:choline-sulfatase
LPQYFAANGYRTLSTGKVYHDGYPPPEGRENGKEFSVWGYPGNHGPFPKKKFVETPSSLWLIDWGIYPERDDQQEDWKVTDWAIHQLKSMPKEQPFFLCVGLRKPHLPCYATQKWFDLYPDASLIMPPVKPNDRDDTPRFSWYLHWTLPEPRLTWLEANHEWRALVRSYLACISFMDSQVGRLLEALEAGGQSGNTIVVLWGDNGWHVGEKGITGKTTLWERSTHVPLIYAGPGITAGGRCGQPAELLDIYPTLVELCGLPAKPGLEGHSLVPQLRDSGSPRRWPAITTHGPNNHTIRTEQWRYIRYADGSEELYDMTKDRNEWDNLAMDPGRAETKRQLAAWLPKINKPPVPGSKTRLIELKDGKPFWEGVPIDPTSQPQ